MNGYTALGIPAAEAVGAVRLRKGKVRSAMLLKDGVSVCAFLFTNYPQKEAGAGLLLVWRLSGLSCHC